jgi:hypothetical protein
MNRTLERRVDRLYQARPPADLSHLTDDELYGLIADRLRERGTPQAVQFAAELEGAKTQPERWEIQRRMEKEMPEWP